VYIPSQLDQVDGPARRRTLQVSPHRKKLFGPQISLDGQVHVRRGSQPGRSEHGAKEKRALDRREPGQDGPGSLAQCSQCRLPPLLAPLLLLLLPPPQICAGGGDVPTLGAVAHRSLLPGLEPGFTPATGAIILT